MSAALFLTAVFVFALAGSLAGLAASVFSKKTGARAEGALSSFTAGLLIAFICFKMLAEGFEAAPFFIGAAGLLAGAVLAVTIDGVLSPHTGGSLSLPFIIAIMLHHLTEGIALGALWAASPMAGIQMSALVSLHIIPEASAVFMSPERNGFNPALTCVLLSLPLAVGSLLGTLLTFAGGILLSVSLTLSAGLMLYFTCGSMLPEAQRRTDAKYAAIFAAAGLILGVVITA